ncbi:MAG: hypothetical protein D6801_09160 [Alphaproteobacteria bacterium]|nr:MAG: hypothetical protein D6801_09160 [Alphaproteobacteria bacterium]
MKLASIVARAALAVSLALQAFSEQLTARIALQLPLKSHRGQNLLLFKDGVEKASNGEIKVEIYDSAQLYKDKEVPAAVGGAPTLISGSEQYLAYQRGTVDIGMTGVSGVKSRKLWEVMDTITVTNHADIEFIVVANTDWWNGLTDAQRQIISDAARKAEIDVRDRVSQIEADAYAAAEAHGMTIHHPTAEEIELWKAAAAPVYDSSLEKAGDLGRQLIDAARAF